MNQDRKISSIHCAGQNTALLWENCQIFECIVYLLFTLARGIQLTYLNPISEHVFLLGHLQKPQVPC